MILKILIPAAALLAISFLAIGCDRQSTVEPPVKPSDSTTKTDSQDGTDAKTPDAVTPDVQSENTSLKPLAEKYTETIPKTLVEFEMILVPDGDSPFYIGSHEVTWDEFDYWALCLDIHERIAIPEREKMLRPSKPFDVSSIYRNWGREGQPVVGVSRMSAQRYCDWLSEKTGKKYRLPTATEWKHAFRAGGGTPDKTMDVEELNKIAWFSGNSLDMEVTFSNRAMPVGKLAPNSIGVYDMLGNAAEWVTGTSEEKIALGGHFLTKPNELTGDHEDIEDQLIWNKNYPQGDKSLWWYFDADYVGFRLVCEPEGGK